MDTRPISGSELVFEQTTPTDANAANGFSAQCAVEVERVPIASLLPAHSPRQGGENLAHTRMLAEVDDQLPPIIVHRSSGRVIDGTHRLGAAVLRGDETIAVRFFDGTEREAFLLAVHANTTHGLPLSSAERSRAAEQILTTYPKWSDRAIAQAAGLGARTVGNIRRRLELDSDVEAPQFRTGRDGRVRPLDNSEGRVKASELIRQYPMASLREIAREAGVSPSTVRDVRARMERGDVLVPDNRRRAAEPGPAPSVDAQRDEPLVASMLEGLRNDPSLRFSESGRHLLRWMFSRAIRPEEGLGMADQVPAHCAYLVADLARNCANEWLQLADELKHRQSDSQ